MTPQVAIALIQLASSRQGRSVINALKGGQSNVITNVLKSVGMKRIRPQDIKDAQDLVTTISNETAQNNAADLQALRGIMMGSPKELALKAVVGALGEATHVAGDISRNNANRLATAILSANRTGTDKHDEVFGKSITDRGNELWAQNKIRKGENVGRILDGVGNVIDKTFGLYNTNDQMRKTAELGQVLGGAPSSIFNMMASQNTRLNRLGM